MTEKKAKVTMFKLKCVGCGMVESRPAIECVEMPFCNKCHMPMTLEEVSLP
jgi:hypothetical protein